MTTASGLFLTPKGTIDQNVLIPNTRDGGNHPHLVDFYIPIQYLTSMVMLHGGEGSKESFAYNLAILKSPSVSINNVRWDLLNLYRVIGIFPQGQHCSGIVGTFNPYGVNTVDSDHPDGVATWSNHVMWSQADDVQFLKDLKTYIISTYGAIGVNLCGHSNGGMMVNRMWYEAPNNYSHYCACSGPASNYYLAHPTLPGTIKPFFQQISLLDAVLDVSDGPAGAGSHFYDATWEQNTAQKGFADVAYIGALPIPDTFWIGEFAQLQTRVTANGGGTIYQGDGVVTSVTIGAKTTWTYGPMVLQLLSNAGHQVISQEQCAGQRVFNAWANFIRAN
jgi:polyhydroxybutyrate depolymerase